MKLQCLLKIVKISSEISKEFYKKLLGIMCSFGRPRLCTVGAENVGEFLSGASSSSRNYVLLRMRGRQDMRQCSSFIGDVFVLARSIDSR